MQDEVTIEIESKSLIDGESMVSYTKSYGKCYFKNQKIYISYSERLEGVASEIPSLLTLDENHIQISRRGEVRSTMKFLQNQATSCEYVTSVGTIGLEIHTIRYATILGEESIEVFLDYSVKMNGADGGINSLHIMIS